IPSYPAHPDLHSFPTRRSSDLPGYSPAVLRRADLRFKTGDLHGAAEDYRRRLTLVPGDPYARLGLVRIALHDGRSTEARRMVERSEEHTSELQSRENLVCRLLL